MNSEILKRVVLAIVDGLQGDLEQLAHTGKHMVAAIAEQQRSSQADSGEGFFQFNPMAHESQTVGY